MAVGLYITAAYWFTASTSFANPAVTVARSFSDTFAGIRPIDMPWFIICSSLARLWLSRFAAGCWPTRKSARGGLKPSADLVVIPAASNAEHGRSHMGGYILAIDQGTTSSRAIVFDDRAEIAGVGQKEFPQHFPKSGWVEHELEDIWQSVVETCRAAIADAGIAASDIAAIGITNQRETVACGTGRRASRCTAPSSGRTGAPPISAIRVEGRKGHEAEFTAKTGLLLDPYFSGTKIAWLLDNVDGLRARAEAGEIAFGTIDTFLIWRLTGGARHVTDATNASRTLIFNIARTAGTTDLLKILRIPAGDLPEVLDCAADFGTAKADILGAEIPVCGVAGDQQAATIGQACFEPGMFKSTYGTGCFALLNTGADRSPRRTAC
jgi:glycerol kinase